MRSSTLVASLTNVCPGFHLPSFLQSFIIVCMSFTMRGGLLSLALLWDAVTPWIKVLAVSIGSLVLCGMSFRPDAWHVGLVLPPYFLIVSELLSVLWVGCISKMGEWDFSGLGEFS